MDIDKVKENYWKVTDEYRSAWRFFKAVFFVTIVFYVYAKLDSMFAIYGQIRLVAGFFAHLIEQLPSKYVSAGAIMLSALVAICMGVYTTNMNRKIARKRATADILTTIETDKDIIAAENTFKTLKTQKFAPLMAAAYKGVAIDPINDRKRVRLELQIITFLNMYENLFLGVMMDVYDELLLFKYKRGAVLTHWKEVEPLIKEWREIDENPALYEVFERFANDWHQNKFVCRGRPFPFYYQHNLDNVIVQHDSILMKH
ncbi:DUF4760 domain-containing protein [Thalassotalea hakodatensis]|uniref:DUF4760 domain-containing protein n=1 Tax=Thalassotalea hakodatensis TaxID=3030492 RepID=UPI0025745E78|nr:DUF4760 domain-containing protein [Thalassotalea hakodatensis]